MPRYVGPDPAKLSESDYKLWRKAVDDLRAVHWSIREADVVRYLVRKLSQDVGNNVVDAARVATDLEKVLRG